MREDAGFAPKAVPLTVASLSLWLAVRLGFLLTAGPCLTLTQKPASPFRGNAEGINESEYWKWASFSLGNKELILSLK